MWLLYGLVISTAVTSSWCKGHRKNPNKENVQRFTIPHPQHPDSAFIPEATVSQIQGNQRASIVGTELPGAYGEDYDMDQALESGSGITSGSGGSGAAMKDTESPESPGKYGTNFVHNPPPSNPSAAFVGNMNETTDDDEEKEETEKKEKEETDSSLSADDSSSSNSSPTTTTTTAKSSTTAAPPKVVSTKKVTKVEKPKVVKKIEKTEKPKPKPKPKTEKIVKIVKAKPKAKAKSHDETNMISKIDAIARQIERVEHKERLDRKEAATLKVAKKVAKKVITKIAAKKKKHKAAPVAVPKKKAPPPVEFETDDETDVKAVKVSKPKKKEAPKERAELKGPEGFECPWACFWTCHSYCPKECCNNPYHCDLACREFCTPYCSDRCCAPGSQRLPKLQLDFNAENDPKNISLLFPEEEHRPQLMTNAFSNASVMAIPKEEESKPHRLDPAENSYQQLKEQQHQLALASQIEALKKATSYAAQLMGLPPECPLACARICLPGLCKQQCCVRSEVPDPSSDLPSSSVVAAAAAAQQVQQPAQIEVPLASGFTRPSAAMVSAENHMVAAAAAAPIAAAAVVPQPQPQSRPENPLVSAPQITPARTQLALANQLALARKHQYLMAHNAMLAANAAATAYRPGVAAAAAVSPNQIMLNNLAYRNKLLAGKSDLVPSLAQYRALQYANQLNKQKMLLERNLQMQGPRQIAADAGKLCQPSYSNNCRSAISAAATAASNAASAAAPSWLHNCPPICKSSCIPQCPNECCLHDGTATG